MKKTSYNCITSALIASLVLLSVTGCKRANKAEDNFNVAFLTDINTSPVYGRNVKPYGLKQLLPSPHTGSACKRMNLFLRWVVRKKDIDFGIWDSVPPSKLIIPLDTHIA